MLIRSGEALGVGWSRNMLYSGFKFLPRSVVHRQTGFAARITRTLCRFPDAMRKLQFGIASLLFAMTFCAIGIATYRYVQYTRRTTEIEACIELMEGSEFIDKHELYRRIFVIAKADMLPDLIKNDSDSVATQSAWETAVRTIPKDGKNRPYKPDPIATELFLATLTERFQITIPNWWRDVVTNCGANSRFSVYSGDPAVDPYHAVLKDDRFNIALIECPTGDQFTETNDGFLYQSKNDKILLPKSMFDSYRSNNGNLFGHATGVFSTSHFYFAFHRNHGDPFDVICIDRTSRETGWTSTVCGSSWNTMGSYLGDPTTWATIEIGDQNQLVVFGACPHGFFAHSMDKNTGETLAEFSEGY